MNVGKAIEIKENHQRLHLGEYYYQELLEADNLSIEALKRERECRENAPREDWLLLPGETKE